MTVSRCTTVQQEIARRFGCRAQTFFGTLPLGCDDVGNAESLLRILDRRGENPDHRELSISRVQFVPTCNRAGNRYGMHAEQRNVSQFAFTEEINQSLRARPTAAVQTHWFAVLLHVN